MEGCFFRLRCRAIIRGLPLRALIATYNMAFLISASYTFSIVLDFKR